MPETIFFSIVALQTIVLLALTINDARYGKTADR